jgi:hypothetical protein
MFRVLRILFLILVTVGALAAVFGVIVAVGVARLASVQAGPASVSVVPDVATQPVTTIPSPQAVAVIPVGADRGKAVDPGKANAPDPARIVLNAADGRLHGSLIRRDGDTHDVIGWSRADDWLDWPIETSPGALHAYHVDVTYACAAGAGGDFSIEVADQKVAGHSEPTGSWADFRTVRLGTIQIPGGKNQLSIKSAPGLQHDLMRLRRVDLVQPIPGEAVAAAPAIEQKPGDGSLTVVGFTLIDTGPNAPIAPLTDGMTIDLSVLPARKLSIRADVAGAPGSVLFGLDANPKLHLEHAAPYAIDGDDNGRFNPWNPPIGEHVLTATPFTGRDGDGAAGKGLTLRFSVVERGRTPIVLKAEEATLHGDGIHVEQVDGGQDIGYWNKSDETAEWPVPRGRRGKFKVLLSYAADNDAGGGDFELSVGDQKLTGHAEPTGGWQKYRDLNVGTVTLERGKEGKVVVIKPTRIDNGRSLMNVRHVELTPAE